jgi:hypothetical protein
MNCMDCLVFGIQWTRVACYANTHTVTFYKYIVGAN